MRAYPLRLKDELADAARLHADRLGISFNALVAVALDAYLHGDQEPAASAKRAPSKTKPRATKPASKAGPKPPPGAGRVELWHPDPGNWRNFHQPDMWPWVDPDWTPPGGMCDPYSAPGVYDPGDVTPAQIKAFEDAYWSVHERPARPWLDASEVPH